VKRLALLAFFVVAACGSVATAQAHTVALAYKTGDTYRYAIHTVMRYTIGMQAMTIPVDLDLSARETMTVKSVDSSGTADFSTELSDLSVKTTINGTTNTSTSPASAGTVDIKVASDGHIVSINGNVLGNNSLPGPAGSQGGLVSAILPDKPVKPGDSWSKTLDEPNPLGTGSSQVTSGNKYLRDEKVGSVNAAVIESNISQNFDISIDSSTMRGSGTSFLPPTGTAGGVQGIAIKGTSVSDVTSWVDTSARRLLKTHSTGSLNATITIDMAAGTTIPGLSGPITLTGTQSLDLGPA
jgi:hypothetical protein